MNALEVVAAFSGRLLLVLGYLVDLARIGESAVASPANFNEEIAVLSRARTHEGYLLRSRLAAGIG